MSLSKVFQGQRNRKKVNDVVDSDDKLDVLKKSIQSNIKAQMSNNNKAVNRSLSEMTALRNAIKSNVIDLGNDKAEYLKTFNRAIDTSTETSLSLKHVTEKATSSLLDSIPSSDSIIGALTVSNPIVGMSVAFIKKLSGDLKESKRIKQEQKKLELDNLHKDAELLNKKESLLDDTPQIDKTDNELVSDKTELVSIKDAIDDQHLTLAKLHDIWSDEPLNAVVDGLERVNESIEETNDELVKAGDQNELDAIAQKERLKEQQSNNALPVGVNNTKKDDEDGGVDVGLLASITTRFPKFGKILSGMGKFLKVGMKFLGPIVGIGLALYNSFKNTGEILGKAEKDLSVFDYVATFIGSLVGSVGAIIDGIAGLFGISTDVQGFLTKKVSKYVANIFTKIGDFFTEIGKWVGEKIFDIIKSIQDFDISDTISNIVNDVKDKISGVFTTIKDFISNTVSDMVNNLNPTNWSIFSDEEIKPNFKGVDTASTKLKQEQAIDKMNTKSNVSNVSNRVMNTNIVNKKTNQTFMKHQLSTDDNVFKQNNQMETIYGA